MKKADINLVCDYIIQRVLTGGEKLNVLKLQKLLYYVQAWHLAFYKKPYSMGNLRHGYMGQSTQKSTSDTLNSIAYTQALALMTPKLTVLP